MKFFSSAITAAIVALTPLIGHAQSYPAKPVKMIVPYPAGGGTDSVARHVAQRLSEAWGQPVVVENRGGAGTIIGAEMVAKSPADGYTLLFTDSSTFLITPHLYSKLPYDPSKAFAPITVVCRLAPVLAVANSVPAASMAELIRLVKENPGKLTYASPGNGSYTHIAMEALKRQAGLDIVHVPYKGSSPAMGDLLSGRVAMYMVTYAVFDSLERAGKLKVLAAATRKRLSVRPDLPTIDESGVPGYRVNVWFGMAAPSGTPESVLDKVHADVTRILHSPEFREAVLNPQALEPGGNSRADFAAELKQESARWAQLVKNSGATVD